MFKPELCQSYNEYKTIVTTIGCKLLHNNPKYSFDSYEEEREKLLSLDLDLLLDFISSFYSEGDRLAQHQAQILHSLILFALLKFMDVDRHDSKNLLYAIDNLGRNGLAFFSLLDVLTFL